MADNAPLISEFLPNACSCRGDYTGCAVCATASTLVRYGKPIPRLSNGTPSMRTLGSLMGAKHRSYAARGTPGDRHGLSLSGNCSPPQRGTNWCTFCAYLELKSRGLSVGHRKLSDAEIASKLKAGYTLIVPGWYGEVPYVARNSYSGSVPARGRSDAGFTGAHMVAAHGVKVNSKGQIISVILTDSDFGSSSRPIVPPHSEWSWSVFLRYYHHLGWAICYVNRSPHILAPSPAPMPPTTNYKAVVHPATGKYFVYRLANGVIVPQPNGRVVDVTKTGFTAPCSAPRVYRWPSQHRSVELIRITGGSKAGQFIDAKFARGV